MKRNLAHIILISFSLLLFSSILLAAGTEQSQASGIMGDSSAQSLAYWQIKVQNLELKLSEMREFLTLLGVLFILVFISMLMVFARLKKIQRIIIDDDYLVLRFFKAQERMKKADNDQFQISLRRLLKSIGITTGGRKED